VLTSSDSMPRCAVPVGGVRCSTRAGKGAQFPGRRMTAGGAKKSNHVKKCTFFNTVHLVQNVPTMYCLQYSAFASKTPRVRAWGLQTCFLTRSLSNHVTPLEVLQNCLLGHYSLSYWSTLLSFSLRHLGHLSRNSI